MSSPERPIVGAATVVGAKADRSTVMIMVSVRMRDDFESVDFWQRVWHDDDDDDDGFEVATRLVPDMADVVALAVVEAAGAANL